MSWFVLYTKPRNEKKTTLLLEKKGYEVYCPVREEIRKWSDRRKKIMAPVFSSYIFLRLDDYKTASADVLSTAGAVRFLWHDHKPGVVRDEEINAIRDFLTAYRNANITVKVSEGQSVTIKEGPLKETKGTIVSIKGSKAFLHLHSLALDIIATVPIQSLSPDNF